jgi:hypothetical protein
MKREPKREPKTEPKTEPQTEAGHHARPPAAPPAASQMSHVTDRPANAPESGTLSHRETVHHGTGVWHIVTQRTRASIVTFGAYQQTVARRISTPRRRRM